MLLQRTPAFSSSKKFVRFPHKPKYVARPLQMTNLVKVPKAFPLIEIAEQASPGTVDAPVWAIVVGYVYLFDSSIHSLHQTFPHVPHRHPPLFFLCAELSLSQPAHSSSAWALNLELMQLQTCRKEILRSGTNMISNCTHDDELIYI